MVVKINENEYSVEKNYRDGYDEEAVKEKMTDYFEPYDYVFGDWAYGKLRLKGFYEPTNKNVNNINNINNLDKYIKENCAYDCKYFLIKKK